MENNVQISRGQAALLMFGSSMGNIIYTFTMVTNITGKPFWIAAFIGVVLNIPFAVWALVLGSYQKGGTLFDLLEAGLGKIICRIMLFIFYFLNISIAICMLNMFVETVKVFYLPRTPFLAIALLLITMCALFANSGMQYLAYIVSALSVLAIVNYYSGFAVSFVNDFQVEQILPVFDSTVSQFLKGVMLTAGSNAECLLFLMVMVGSISHNKKYYLSVVKGLFAWSVVLSTAILIMEGISSNELLSRVGQAGITVASTIQVGSFIRGLEVFLLMTYQYMAIMKTSICLYLCWGSAKKFFNVPKGRPLLIITAFILLISTTWINSFNAGYFLAVFLGAYVIFPFVALVLILCTVSAFIKNTRNGSHER